MPNQSNASKGNKVVSDETIRKVRLGSQKGKKIKELARLYKISKNTVRKILRSTETSFQYKKRIKQSYPALGEFLEPLKQRLEANKGLDRKRRKTLTVIHEELISLGYQGSYSSVRRYHQVLKDDNEKQLNDAFIPLEFEPGEAFQFDWSHEHIKIKGNVVKIKVAHFILSHSSMPFLRAYYRESTEMVLDAHNHAFKFYDGLCEKGIYDNMKTAVSKILNGKDREFNKRFLSMCNHYLFRPIACTPASGWEKGQVERQVATMRPRFFNDIIEVDSLHQLNNQLTENCVKWARQRMHPKYKNQTIWDTFLEERKSLIKNQLPFDCYAIKHVKASKTCLIRFDNNFYSVDYRAANKTVELRIYAERLVFVHENQIVGQHIRKFGDNEHSFDVYHYLPILKKKPGALRNGTPFKNLVLPKVLEDTQIKLSEKDDSDKEYAEILSYIPEFGIWTVLKACELALSHNNISKDLILAYVFRSKDEQEEEQIEVPKRLELDDPPIADCKRYNLFLKGYTNDTQQYFRTINKTKASGD